MKMIITCGVVTPHTHHADTTRTPLAKPAA
jgi:hypothetical protein